MDLRSHEGAPHQADILIVDDTVENLWLLSSILTSQGYHVRKAINGAMGLRAIETALPDLVLLDIMMPDLDGYDVCRRLKADPATAEIPVIFLSALNEALDKVKAFEVGGIDYITKPFQTAEVVARTRNQLMLRSVTQALNRLNFQLEAQVKERTHQLELANEQLLDLAYHDMLTQLPNRVLFMECLAQLLEAAEADPGYTFAVLFLDCDRFKLVNDAFGHSVGDDLLIAVAQRLTACLSEDDTLARLGGDEFAILLPQVVNIQDATDLAQQILDALSHRFLIPHGEVFLSASIGIVLSSAIHHHNPEHLLRDADTAMYAAKSHGKGCYKVFNPIMHQASLEQLQVETDLHRAVEQAEFVLHYQPIVALQTGKITGVEALIRWEHPDRGLLMPDTFIMVAEETGLIVPMGQQVLKSACDQLRRWQQQSTVEADFFMSVNLSVRQFAQPRLVESIVDVLQVTGLQPHHLRLEITESAILNNAIAAKALRQLQDKQIHLSIDDFGTGYSSLSYLHLFPISSLKIDRSFTQRLSPQHGQAGLIPAILGMAQALKMKVVAEGIETLEQLTHLRELACYFGQGYFFSKPLPAEDLTALLATDPRW